MQKNISVSDNKTLTGKCVSDPIQNAINFHFFLSFSCQNIHIQQHLFLCVPNCGILRDNDIVIFQTKVGLTKRIYDKSTQADDKLEKANNFWLLNSR